MAIHPTILRILLLSIVFRRSFSQTIIKERGSVEINHDAIISKNHQMQPKSIDPSLVIQLSWNPRVFVYRNFLSEEECDYLISKGTAISKLDMKETIDGISLDSNDEIGSRIEEKISAWTFSPKENGKALKVVRYGVEDAKQNYEYFRTKSSGQIGELLLATVVLYLSNSTRGGMILFPESKNKMKSDCGQSNHVLQPTKGNAILFFNLHLNTTLDRSSFHARCPVLKGEMWCAVKSLYLKQISVENSFSQSNNPDCTDEDDNCPHWATMGECQRNSVFMIGSPDYYGTCRKSCKAC